MALCAAIAWAAARIAPAGLADMPIPAAFGAALVAAGIALNVLPKLHFRRAGTPVNPLRPQAATRRVENGLHRYSRNPMYLGHALILLGLAMLLRNALALIVVPAYMTYVTRFQILAEERALRARFGAAYLDDCRRVRRWL